MPCGSSRLPHRPPRHWGSSWPTAPRPPPRLVGPAPRPAPGLRARDDAEAFLADLGEPPRSELPGAEFAEPDYGGWAQASATALTGS